MALTTTRDTVELHTGGTVYSYKRTAGAKIFAGALVAQNASGLAVPAVDGAGLVILGRAENTAETGEEVIVKRGCFIYGNGSGSEEVALSAIGSVCYCLDDATVGAAGGTNKIAVGKVLDVTADGVAVEI